MTAPPVSGFDVPPSWSFDDLAQAFTCRRAQALMAGLLAVSPALLDRPVWRFLHDPYVRRGRIGRMVADVVSVENAYRLHPAGYRAYLSVVK